MKTVFTEAERFFDELMKDNKSVDRNIVRIERTCVPTLRSVTIFRHILKATATIAGELIELHQDFGVSWYQDTSDRAAQAAERTTEWLTEQLQEQGFDVRSGVIVEG